MPLQIQKDNSADAYVVRVRGEVDLYSSPDLRQAVTEGCPRESRTVAVDLREVPYMDSSGVATLVEGLRAAKLRQASFVLLAPSEQVRKVLTLARLDTVFDIRDEL